MSSRACLLSFILCIILVTVTLNSSASGETSQIPAWVKNNAKWWSEGQIGDSDFIKGMQYLVQNGIMSVTFENTCYTPNLSLNQAMEYGFQLANQGNDEEAMTCYDMALKLDPNNSDALFNKGLALDHLGKYQDAISYYDKVLAIQPNATYALYNKASVSYSLGSYQNAMLYYNKVLAIDPNDIYSLDGKASALEATGRYQMLYHLKMKY